MRFWSLKITLLKIKQSDFETSILVLPVYCLLFWRKVTFKIEVFKEWLSEKSGQNVENVNGRGSTE